MIMQIKKIDEEWQKKLEHVLLYHFLNDENHTQTVSSGKEKLIRPLVLKHEYMKVAFAVLICKYTRRRNVCWYRITHIYVCFGYIILNKSGQKSHQKSCGVMRKSFSYSNLSSKLSSCTRVSYKPRLILYPSKVLPTRIFFSFSQFFSK